MTSKMTDAERAVVEGILSRESAMGYEIEYTENERLPLIHPADRARAAQDARHREEHQREPTPAEQAEADRLAAVLETNSHGIPAPPRDTRWDKYQSWHADQGAE